MKTRWERKATGTTDDEPTTTMTTGALAKLGREVSASLEQARTARKKDDDASTSASSRIREKLMNREVPAFRANAKKSAQKGQRIITVAVGSLAVAAAIAVFYTAWKGDSASPSSSNATTSPTPSALSFTIGEAKGTTGAFIAAPPSNELPVNFSDGSKVRLAPEARARVAEVAHDGARVLVESGTVHVAVVHRDEATKWAVEAGPFEVRVTGTKFDLSYDPSGTGLIVKLREGSVFVRGCGMGEGRRLTTGEQLNASCKDLTSKISPISDDNNAATTATNANALPDAPQQQQPVAAAAKAPDPTSASTSTSQVIALAKSGAHAEALNAAEANGFAKTCDTLSGPDLLVLADAARYAGRFDRANEALMTVRKRFQGSDFAAVAAFELGRIAMDVKRDLNAAGDHFETYLRERPSGSLAREALGRALEARHRAGETARAERLAIRYLDAYPDGPHAKLAHKLRNEDSH